MLNTLFADTEIISSYTREEAIEDGVLVDVTNQAKAAGFRYPVAVSQSLWEDYIDLFDDRENRLWDLLWSLRLKAMNSDLDTITFNMSFRMPTQQNELLKVVAHCGPGDLLEPVITICLPEDS